MKVITYDEWTEQTERMTKQQIALLKAQDSVGKSAYEIALGELGLTEEELTVEDWLASLKGSSAYDVYVESYDGDGDPLDEESWLLTLVGEGGLSAYEIALEEGFDGNEEAWLLSLKGENGADGDSGPDGESAYELAVVGGFVGDETAWLASLKGADGVSAYELAVEGGLNDVEVGEEYEGEEPIDEATFGALLAELIREKFTSNIGEE